MRTYIDELKEVAAGANLRHEAEVRKRRYADPRVLCDQPLTEQIEELMRSLSPAQRDRPWSMEELVARLQGRYNARPHPMNVGQALRVLGWTQKRDYTRQGGGRRVWVYTNSLQ